MQLYFFSFLFITIFSLLTFFIHKRLIQKLHLNRKVKHLLSLFLILNFMGVLGYFAARYFINLPNWLYFLLSLPIGVIFLLTMTTFVYEIFHFMLLKTPLKTTRRSFLKKSLDISSLSIAAVLGAKSVVNAKTLTIENIEVKIKNLKSSYKIAQISDIHIGGVIDKDFVMQIVEKVNALQADLVVITGDLVDVHVSQAKESLDALKLLQSKYGTYYIVGNHEYFHGIEEIIQNVRDRGIKPLENENLYIGEIHKGFYLAGVYDLFGYRTNSYIPDLNKALNGIQNDPVILLAHQPKFIYAVDKRVSLILSGHTHGGQIYPFGLLVSLVQPYISGLHQYSQDTQIYVNKGTGFWGPPMRLGTSAEITSIVILPS